ncbi:MAG: zf-HC2 domain-containing protein [Acidobacteria bacterium]|nr:zf-HC2 domain-containing protein [Acidobacteriota bacterium]MBI3423178.1 zf-HC2 domain-containing protein [Acidobacteriota bacterium]
MTHQEVQQGEIVERFVRRQLTPDERRAFQEHYFGCEECFEQVEMTARFVAGVRQASRQGLLAESVAERWWPWRVVLFKPALGFAVATGLALAVAFGWLLFKQNSAPRQELAIQQTPTPTPHPAVTPGTTSTPTPGARPKLQNQPDLLAQNRPPQTPDLAPGKAPVVFLDSERDGSGGGNQLTIPANAASAALRIEVEPNSSYSGFQFQLFDNSKRLVTTVNSGKASPRGAISASVPANLLQTGKYVVKCYGLHDGQRELVGEYKLQVQKP